MKKQLLLLSLIFVMLFSQYETKANKIMASDLTWRCVGQDSFLVKLVVYTDCNGEVLISTPIIASCLQTGIEITRITINTGTPYDVTPMCGSGCTRCSNPSCSFPYGIQRYTMQGMIKLNGAGSCCSIKLTWEQCCRNTSITTGAAGVNFYTEAILNRCQNPCDNSPFFTAMPVAILCVGQVGGLCSHYQDFDLNTTGGVADSFTYEWAEPLSAANTPISYLSPNTYNKAINFFGFPNDALPLPRGLHLDAHISFQPMKSEVTIMVIKLNEFRNGVKIAELRREIQIITITCLNNIPPTISTPNNVKSKSVCAGDTVTFDFSTNDPNINDTVTLSWNNAIPGATWTHTNGITKHPTGRLTWIPTVNNISNIPYNFSVKAMDNSCLVRGSFTQEYQITVTQKTGIKIIQDQLSQSDFKIYPNPASDYLNIEYQGLSKWEGKLLLFDPNSKLLISKQLDFNQANKRYALSLTGFAPGIYLIRLENISGLVFLKLLVQ